MNGSFLIELFKACFWFGAAATVFSSFLGFGHHGSIPLPHGGHVAVHHVGFGHASTRASAISLFNLTSLLAFLVVFGAVGLALQGGLGGVLALMVAIAAGLVAGWVVFLLIARFLVRGETFLTDEPLVGTLGTVSIPIGPGRVGEIIYNRHGVRRSDGARAIDEQSIGVGEEVVIISLTSGIVTVQRWKEFLVSGRKDN